MNDFGVMIKVWLGKKNGFAFLIECQFREKIKFLMQDWKKF
jgi:hypothetical protein